MDGLLPICPPKIKEQPTHITSVNDLMQTIIRLNPAGLLHSVLNRMNACVITTTLDGIIIHWNERATALHQWTPQEMIGKPIALIFESGFIHPNDIIPMIARNGYFQHETVGRKKDGTTFATLCFLSLLTIPDSDLQIIISIGFDISDNKQTEQQLLYSEQRFELAFHNSPQPMAILTRSGAFVNANQSCLKLLGYLIEDLVGHNVDELGMLEFPKHKIVIENLLATTDVVSNFETQIKTKSGEIRTGILTIGTFMVGNDKQLLITINDVTDMKKISVELARLERLSLIGQMAASIGHEVRNPMTTVRGYLQYLYQKQEFCQHHSTFELMIDELDRANLIISEFLALSKDKAIKLNPTDLNKTIYSLYPLLQALALPDGKEIKVEADQALPLIDIDEKEIRQLIINLAKNGLEAMSSNGVLTVQTSKTNDHVILSIIDQGCGMPEHVLNTIGTPFVTTKEKGTGLGLPVCYSIASRNHATINIAACHPGTRFDIRFNR